MHVSSIIAYSIIGVLLFAFLLLAYRDLAMLVRRPWDAPQPSSSKLLGGQLGLGRLACWG